MRETHPLVTDIDRYLEDALRATQQLDAQRWRDVRRPRAMRSCAARATTLRWSRALLNLVVQELYPDDPFTELMGDLDRIPPRQWPGAIAVGIALRHSGRRDGLTRVARRLGLRLTTTDGTTSATPINAPDHHATHSPARLAPVKALRYAPTPRGGAHGLDGPLG